jgi:hypothetical protein
MDLEWTTPTLPNGGIPVTIRRSFVIAVLLGTACLFPETAWARPKHSTFEEMIEGSTTIAVASFLGDKPDRTKHTIQVEVSQVLKGDLKPGKQQFAFADLPHVSPKGEEFVAFLDKDRVWRFIASPLKGETRVDRGVLQISGFYDYNAYWVTPGLATLDQLKTYLKKGSLVYRFRGDISFPQPGKAEWKAGTLVLSGTSDVVNKKVNVKGLPNLKGFPAQPEVDVHSRGGPHIDLAYATVLNRPLKLIGKVSGYDKKTGEVMVRFAVSAPEVLTQRALEDYLADAGKGTCYYRFKLNCTPEKNSPVPKVLFVTVGKWSENKWNSTRIEGFDPSPLHVFSTSYNGPTLSSGSIDAGGPEAGSLPKTMADEAARRDWVLRMSVKTRAGAFLTLGFEVGEPKASENAFSWAFKNELLYTLYRNQVKGTVTLHDGKTARTVATFTTTLDSVEFNRNEKSE